MVKKRRELMFKQYLKYSFQGHHWLLHVQLSVDQCSVMILCDIASFTKVNNSFIPKISYPWLLDTTFSDFFFFFLRYWSYFVSPVNPNFYKILKFGTPWRSFFESFSILFFCQWSLLAQNLNHHLCNEMTPKFISLVQTPPSNSTKLCITVYLISLSTPLTRLSQNVDFSPKPAPLIHLLPITGLYHCSLSKKTSNNKKTKLDSSLTHFIHIPLLICQKPDLTSRFT